MRLIVIDPDGFDVHREQCEECFGDGEGCSYCGGVGHYEPRNCDCDWCVDEREFLAEEPRP